MKKITEALKELKLTWNIIQGSEQIVEGMLVITIALAFIIFIGISWVYSLIPFLIYVGYKTYQYIKGNLFKSIEEKTPNLKEKLRTAAEFKDKETQMVKELNEDVVKEIKKVKSSFLVDYKTVAYRLLGLICLSFMVIIFSTMNINLGGVEGISYSINQIKFINEEKMDIPDIAIASEEGDLDIYGDASVAELGLEKQELEVNALDSEIDLNKIGGVEKKTFAPQSIPKEIYTTYDVSYNERIPKENQKIVKNYFEKITR